MSQPPDKHGPASGNPASGEMSPQERAQLEDRISDLGSRLGKARSERRESEGQADSGAEARRRGMAYGMRMAADLVAAVIVGSVIGWGLDWVLGSRPWLFLIFFMLGFAAGVLNVVRAYERMQRELAPGQGNSGTRAGPAVPDNDDD
jgi:ATP synthase protein I